MDGDSQGCEGKLATPGNEGLPRSRPTREGCCNEPMGQWVSLTRCARARALGAPPRKPRLRGGRRTQGHRVTSRRSGDASREGGTRAHLLRCTCPGS